MPRCWSWKLERTAGRAAALADVTPAIEAILEENMDAEDILRVDQGQLMTLLDGYRAEKVGAMGLLLVLWVMRWKRTEGKMALRSSKATD